MFDRAIATKNSRVAIWWMMLPYSCEFPAYRSHFVFGVMAPPDFRRNGATTFSA
ncbi:hypothetical protein SBC1_02750 [Caballeronia sp. SBC1]|nr:hypothetical protein SBC1_02750 [Caballeronia sp. SBC1]